MSATAKTGPLAGLKVLDFSTLLPGPYATMMLADMGADVLKIVSPDRPDMAVHLPPMFKSENRQVSYLSLTLDRGKRSVAMDLKSAEAVEAIKSLIAEYDIVMEQFRPGVMARLGLDYDSLKAINPKLIYCSLTGYGQTGPMKDSAGHDINYLAVSGLASYSGTAESGPVLSGTQIADIAGGSHHAVMAIMAAVIERNSTGAGQHLDVSMTDAAFALNTLSAPGSLATGHSPGLSGTALNGGSFYGYYKTKDGQHIAVGSLEPKFAQQFFAAIGQPEWVMQSMDQSPASQQSLIAQLKEIFLTKPLDDWMTQFAGLDMCVTPVIDLNTAASSELMTEREMVLKADVDGKTVPQVAPAIKFESVKAQPTSIPIPGEHTVEVLAGLGFSKEQISKMVGGKV